MVQVAGQVLLGDPSLQLRGEGGSQQPGARRRSSQAQRKRQVFGIVGVGLEHPPSTWARDKVDLAWTWTWLDVRQVASPQSSGTMLVKKN